MNATVQKRFAAADFAAILDASDLAVAKVLTKSDPPVRVVATLERDFDGDMPDPEVYSAAQIAEWEKGEWTFWGMRLSVWIGRYRIERDAASIWGIDCVDDDCRNDAHLADLANGLLASANVADIVRNFAAKVAAAAEAAGGAR